MKYLAALVFAGAAFAQFNTTLAPVTIEEFDRYQAGVDAELKRGVMWIDSHPEARTGRPVTHAITGADGKSVTGGLIHDWVGAVYLRGVPLATVRDFLLATERHAAAFPDVKQATTLSRSANASRTRLRLVKKRIIVVTLEIEYENLWSGVANGRWTYRVRSSRVSEVQDGRLLPPGTGHGFLWRMNSDWTLREDTEGTWAELRSVSLSRDTPSGLGWIVKPLIRNFPAEAIQSTLDGLAKAVRP